MANTSSRTLRLLSLLQTHRFWPGPELAGRLEVSDRTLRRDIDRLRELGYPVDALRGSEGGYQLGAGATMPPLTVDEDEAIAMVVALGGAAHNGSGAMADASVSALSKIVQVLPPKLRRRAESLRAVTDDTPFSPAPSVDAEVLATIAQAIRDTERVRFTYTARGGSSAGEELPRHVEPHRLVTVGRRWYLVAYDLGRQDWRSFRLDRLHTPVGTRAPFRPRGIPGGDAGAFVRRGLSRNETEHVLVARYAASAERVAGRIGHWGTVTAIDDGSCRLQMQGSDARWLLFGLGVVGEPFVLEAAPDAVRAVMADWAGLFAAPGPTPARTPTPAP